MIALLRILVAAVVLSLFASVASAQIITSAVKGGTGLAPEAPVIQVGGLVEDVDAFVDRTHEYNNIPAAYLGTDFVQVANDDKTVSDYTLTIAMSGSSALVCLILDDRINVAVAMPWVAVQGFTDTGDNIDMDESGDGDIDQTSSVYCAVKQGSVTLTAFEEQDDGGSRNMYGVLAVQGAVFIGKATNPSGGGGFALTHDFPFISSPFSPVNDGGFFQVLAAPGNYTLTEVDPTPGFDLTDLACPEDGTQDTTVNIGTRQASIGLQHNETVTCTFTNTERGTVNIDKVTAPAGGTGFSYTTTLGGGFGLDDGDTQTFNNVVPGTYTVTENDPAPLGFELTSLSCTDSDSGGTDSTGDVPSRTATINLDPGETVDCTFGNGVTDVDLTISKSCHAETFFTTCNIQVFNFGPGAALNVVVDDPIPAGLSWSSDDCGAGPPAGGVLSWDVGTLSSGNGDVCEVIFAISPGANNIKNTAFVSTDNPDTDPSNDSSETTAVPAVIPTLSEWGRLLLMVVLAMAGLLGARRRLA